MFKLFKIYSSSIGYFFASFVYLMFVAMIPIYVYIIMHRKNRVGKFVASVCSTALVAIIIFYIINITACPYPSSKIGELLYMTRNEGVISGIKGLLEFFLTNVKAVTVENLLNTQHNLIICYFFSYFIMMIVFGGMVVWNWRKKKNINWASIYVLNVFLFGFLFLYTSNYWNLIRGINVALVFAMYWSVTTAEQSINSDRNKYEVLYEAGRMMIYGSK